MAWDMFQSAIAEIFRRFVTALKITIVPFLIMLAMFGGIGAIFYTNFAITIIMALVAFLASLVLGGLVAGMITTLSLSSFASIQVTTILIGGVAGVILQFIWLRMATILPGIAVDRTMATGEGWSGTAEIAGQIFLLSVIINVITIGFSLLMIPLQLVSPVLAVILQIPFNFLFLIFGISILTEIYKRTFHTDPVGDVFA